MPPPWFSPVLCNLWTIRLNPCPQINTSPKCPISESGGSWSWGEEWNFSFFEIAFFCRGCNSNSWERGGGVGKTHWVSSARSNNAHTVLTFMAYMGNGMAFATWCYGLWVNINSFQSHFQTFRVLRILHMELSGVKAWKGRLKTWTTSWSLTLLNIFRRQTNCFFGKNLFDILRRSYCTRINIFLQTFF